MFFWCASFRYHDFHTALVGLNSSLDLQSPKASDAALTPVAPLGTDANRQPPQPPPPPQPQRPQPQRPQPQQPPPQQPQPQQPQQPQQPPPPRRGGLQFYDCLAASFVAAAVLWWCWDGR